MCMNFFQNGTNSVLNSSNRVIEAIFNTTPNIAPNIYIYNSNIYVLNVFISDERNLKYFI